MIEATVIIIGVAVIGAVIATVSRMVIDTFFSKEDAATA
jgi:mannose/fructose/N-acetylgalactosamine-specific phosphotransferase system component IID